MKKLAMALCLAALGVACKASGANMSDTSPAAKDCGDCATSCTAEEKAACDSAAKSECSGEAKVCPVTGKTMN
ncbi:MAG TPA: hypothetical protein VF530_15620 [Planctomycetota bacterium]